MAWSRNQSDSPDLSGSSQPEVQHRASPRTTATLGPSLFFKGNLSGEEDLLIEGRVEGEVSLKNQNVTVGPTGKVSADIYSKSIRIEGEVNGNLYGSEEVAIRKSGRVQGNAIAPRVTLENGAQFRGSIDMNPEEGFTAGKPSSAPSKPPARPDKRNLNVPEGRPLAATPGTAK